MKCCCMCIVSKYFTPGACIRINIVEIHHVCRMCALLAEKMKHGIYTAAHVWIFHTIGEKVELRNIVVYSIPNK